MQKKVVNQKRDVLKKLSNEALIDRICGYSNQRVLNENSYGTSRELPVGKVAHRVQHQDYQMTEKQRYALIHHFSALTVPETKVVGITFRKNNAEEFEKTHIDTMDRRSTYETSFTLRPEPENPHDPNAVMVLVNKTDGDLHQVGYVSRAFLEQHPGLSEEQVVQGRITDYSKGAFKNVSYSFYLDTEELDNRHALLKENDHVYTDADLGGIGDLSLDIHGIVEDAEVPDFKLETVTFDDGSRGFHVLSDGAIPDAFWDDLTELAEQYGFSGVVGRSVEQDTLVEEVKEPAPQTYRYARPVTLTDACSIPNVADANAHFATLGIGKDAKNELEYWGISDKHHVLDVGYHFDEPQKGYAFVKADAPLSNEALSTLASWTNHLETDGFAVSNMRACLRHGGNPAPDTADVFQHGRVVTGFTLESGPEVTASPKGLQLTEADLEGLNFSEDVQL